MNTSRILLVIALVTMTACGKGGGKTNATPAESPLILSEKVMGECPDISGTYSCLDKADNTNHKSTFLLNKTSTGYRLDMAEDGEKKTFVDYLVEKYMLDDGGFLIDGRIHDKTENLRTAIKYIIDASTSPALRALAFAMGIDFEKEVKKFDVNSLKSGYVGYCANQKLTLHYVVGQSDALKVTVSKGDNQSLWLDGVNVEEGKVKRESGSCQLVTKSTPPPPPSSAPVQPPKVQVQAENPEKIHFKLESIKDQGEALHLKFSKPGIFSKGSKYILRKAFWGETDDMGDDVNIEIPNEWRAVYLDSQTSQLMAEKFTGETLAIGKVYSNGKIWLVEFSVKIHSMRTWGGLSDTLILDVSGSSLYGKDGKYNYKDLR